MLIIKELLFLLLNYLSNVPAGRKGLSRETVSAGEGTVPREDCVGSTV